MELPKSFVQRCLPLRVGEVAGYIVDKKAVLLLHKSFRERIQKGILNEKQERRMRKRMRARTRMRKRMRTRTRIRMRMMMRTRKRKRKRKRMRMMMMMMMMRKDEKKQINQDSPKIDCHRIHQTWEHCGLREICFFELLDECWFSPSFCVPWWGHTPDQ